jgi:ABC-type glycerol-3-phosphate transport system substrate-binding protein
MNTRDAAAFFHDGKAAFHLMGTWVLTAGRLYAADKKGLPEAKLGWFFFPEVQDGKEVDYSGWICVAMDQLLGRKTGRTFNGEAAAVAAGTQSPEKATQAIESFWSQNRI